MHVHVRKPLVRLSFSVALFSAGPNKHWEGASVSQMIEILTAAFICVAGLCLRKQASLVRAPHKPILQRQEVRKQCGLRRNKHLRKVEERTVVGTRC